MVPAKMVMVLHLRPLVQVPDQKIGVEWFDGGD